MGHSCTTSFSSYPLFFTCMKMATLSPAETQMENCTKRKIAGDTHPPKISPPVALLSVLLKLVP